MRTNAAKMCFLIIPLIGILNISTGDQVETIMYYEGKPFLFEEYDMLELHVGPEALIFAFFEIYPLWGVDSPWFKQEMNKLFSKGMEKDAVMKEILRLREQYAFKDHLFIREVVDLNSIIVEFQFMYRDTFDSRPINFAFEGANLIGVGVHRGTTGRLRSRFAPEPPPPEPLDHKRNQKKDKD